VDFRSSKRLALKNPPNLGQIRFCLDDHGLISQCLISQLLRRR
jgi:hypothetical protein